MTQIVYDCHSCGKESEFDTESTPQLMLDDTAERPITYTVKCPHCGAQNSVTP